MLEHALTYARRGWAVFPLHTPDADGNCSCRKAGCSDAGKHPRTINGLTGATIDEEQIAKWWEMWPDANIGLAAGEVSGLVVIDIDPRHGGDVSIRRLQEQHGQFVERVYANTGGGGWHLLFKHPGVRIRNVQSSDRLGAGVDVRGDGGYIVAPPSLHVSGNRYSWGVEPTELPEMSQWLITLLAEPQRATAEFVGEGEIAEGGRNKSLTSMAGSMRRRGMSEEAMYAALSVENERRCRPPLEDADVRKIAHSVARYAPDDPAYEYPEQTAMEGERPDGIYYVSEFADRIMRLYESGMKGGVSTGKAALDWHYTVKLKQWTVITGQPSAGKSAFLDDLLYNLAMLHEWRFAITSAENQPLERHAAQLMALYAGEPFGKGDIPRMSVKTAERAMEWLDKHFVFVLPDEGGSTVAGILERVHWVYGQQALQGVVIDPWNELEHRRPAGMSETEYVSQSLTRMRRFARSNDLHLWLVAHPTKLQKDPGTKNYPVPTLYDISGSAHFRNKADMGLSLWRDLTNEKSPVQIHVQKVRYRECGRPGKCELYMDVVTGRYQETMPSYGLDSAAEESRAVGDQW
jgi:hypothetical protein